MVLASHEQAPGAVAVAGASLGGGVGLHRAHSQRPDVSVGGGGGVHLEGIGAGDAKPQHEVLGETGVLRADEGVFGERAGGVDGLLRSSQDFGQGVVGGRHRRQRHVEKNVCCVMIAKLGQHDDHSTTQLQRQERRVSTDERPEDGPAHLAVEVEIDGGRGRGKPDQDSGQHGTHSDEAGQETR